MYVLVLAAALAGCKTSAVVDVGDTDAGEDTDAGVDTGASSDTEDPSGNRAPTVTTPTLSVASARVGDVVLCSASASDPDGGTPSISYRWSNGEAGASMLVTAANSSPGGTVVCTATASDTAGAFATASSAPLNVLNSAPVFTAKAMSPSIVRTLDDVTGAFVAVDPDGDAITVSYQWTVTRASASFTSLTGLVLPNETTKKGDLISLTAEASDGTATTSDTILTTVINTDPEDPVVRISPAAPWPGDPLVCEVVSPAYDPDVDDGADAIAYAFTWWFDGDAGRAEYTGDLVVGWKSTVPAGEIEADATWECEVEALDQSGASAADDDYIYVLEAMPGLLETHPTTLGAYSLRRVDPDYRGPALRVRRSADNAEADIGFSSGWIDEDVLLAFVGSDTDDQGYVVTWYNQSDADGLDYTNATAATQPRIVVNGALSTYGGMPAIRFDGGKDLSRNWVGGSPPATLSWQIVYASTNVDGQYVLQYGGQYQYAGMAEAGSSAVDAFREFNGAGTSGPSGGTYVNGASAAITTRGGFYASFPPSPEAMLLWSSYAAQPAGSWGSLRLGGYAWDGVSFQGAVGEAIYWSANTASSNASVSSEIVGGWGL